jgi:hypothetical protein
MFRCIPVHFAHQAQLNAHVRLLETKMAVGRENDEYRTVYVTREYGGCASFRLHSRDEVIPFPAYYVIS